MVVVIPIRGHENITHLQKCSQGFIQMINELPDLKNDTRLIKLIDDHEEKKFYCLDGIDFEFITDQNNVLIKDISRNNSFFHTDYISTYLKINFIQKPFYEAQEDTYSISANIWLRKISFLLNLTFNTPITFLPGVVIKNSEYTGRTDIVINSFDYAYEHANTIRWPNIISLNLDQTLNWFIEHESTLYSSSNCKLGIAMNAFSNLFRYQVLEKDTGDLFWCMVGLEALYCEGSQNLLEQLRLKSNSVLGEPKEYKKKLNKLYDFRSRLVHGQLNLPALFGSDYENFEDRYWDYIAFATSILLASIRIGIARDLTNFKFSFTWSNK